MGCLRLCPKNLTSTKSVDPKNVTTTTTTNNNNNVVTYLQLQATKTLLR